MSVDSRRNRQVFLLIFLFSLAGLTRATASGDEDQTTSCRDERGSPVDWFVMYKLPRLEHSPHPLVRAGLAYVYLSSSSSGQTPSWTLSNLSVNDTSSLPGRTLAPLYGSLQNQLVWLLYNDQSPDEPVSYEHGHTKGVILGPTQGQGHSPGLWLVHSVPHFPPPANASYGYPKTGEHYGQSFLCITIKKDNLDGLGSQLRFNWPKIYSSQMTSDFPQLTSVSNGQKVKVAPFYRQMAITSAAGQTFQTFAKTSQFAKDLYSDWVSAALQTNLLVESWPNGPGRLPSVCNRKFKVENVLGLSISAAGAEFGDHQDHSKWAVQEPQSGASRWICIGDINRMESQLERGGGTVCMDKIEPWEVFRSAVTKWETCSPPDSNHL